MPWRRRMQIHYIHTASKGLWGRICTCTLLLKVRSLLFQIIIYWHVCRWVHGHGRRLHQVRIRPPARRRVLVYGRLRLDHRPYLPHVRTPAEWRNQRRVRGRPHPPGPLPYLAYCREIQGACPGISNLRATLSACSHGFFSGFVSYSTPCLWLSWSWGMSQGHLWPGLSPMRACMIHAPRACFIPSLMINQTSGKAWNRGLSALGILALSSS